MTPMAGSLNLKIGSGSIQVGFFLDPFIVSGARLIYANESK
jgi:hypothetical protein